MKSHKSIEEYIANEPPEVQKTLKVVRERIKAAAPKDAEETISYGMPTFKVDGKPLAHFAAFKDHCSYFPAGATDPKLAKDVKPYVAGKGTLHFPLDKPLSKSLIKKLVDSRLQAIRST